MKKLFQQIDDLCHRAHRVAICNALNIYICTNNEQFTIRLGNQDHIMPTDSLWRRKWRTFLTDHADDVANNLASVAAAAHDEQSGSGV